MQEAITETERRRVLQLAHNERFGIVPRTVEREVTKSITPLQQAISDASKQGKKGKKTKARSKKATEQILASLEREMDKAAHNRDYERAIQLREQLKIVQEEL